MCIFFNKAEVLCVLIKAAEEKAKCSYVCEMDSLFELCIKGGLEHLEMRIFPLCQGFILHLL